MRRTFVRVWRRASNVWAQTTSTCCKSTGHPPTTQAPSLPFLAHPLCLPFVSRPDRYVPLFGEYEYRAEKERQAVGFEEQLKALQEMVTSGKVCLPTMPPCTLHGLWPTDCPSLQVRHIGVSNETSFGVMEFIRAAESSGLPRIVSIQNSYSLLVRTRFEGQNTDPTLIPTANRFYDRCHHCCPRLVWGQWILWRFVAK